MPKVCQITGKKRSTGHNVSHSVRRTKRTFDPNLQTKRIFNPETGRYIKIRVSAKGLKSLTKNPKKFLKKIA